MTGRITALLDGSIYAKSVCELAGWAAARTGRAVDLLHVLGRRDLASAPADFSGSLNFDERDHLLAALAGLDEQKAKLAQERGRLLLAQASAWTKAAGAADISQKLRHGDLIDTVVDLEAECDLIVIGKRGEAADFAKLHLGSNLERVARAVRKPVMVAARLFQAARRVLIAYDGGPSAEQAVAHIAAGTLFSGLPLHLLMVGDPAAAARGKLEQAGSSLVAAGYQVTTEILPGEADRAIAHAVQDKGIDLLVMGAYGHSRLRNLIIGSATTEMLRSCKIPVMLFR